MENQEEPRTQHPDLRCRCVNIYEKPKTKPLGRRISGRPRKRRVDDGEQDLRMMNIRGCRRICKESTERMGITAKGKTHIGL